MLILNFDEPIHPNSLLINLFLFQNVSSISYPSSIFSPSNAAIIAQNGLQFTLQLMENDINIVKKFRYLFTSINDSFISHSTLAFHDLFFNPSIPLLNTSGLMASSFISDTTRPFLNCYSIDMDSGAIILTFSETIDIFSINFTGLTLHRSLNTSNDPFLSYTLTTGILDHTINGIFVRFIFSKSDFDQIKRQRIGTSMVTTYIALTQFFISDMDNNLLIPLIEGLSARSPCNYSLDGTPPSLIDFYLDLNGSLISLTFSEPIIFLSLNPQLFTLSSSRESGTLFTFLNTSSVTTQQDDTIIVLPISKEDINVIKRLQDLATNINNTFLFHADGSFFDVFSNPTLNRSQLNSLAVSFI